MNRPKTLLILLIGGAEPWQVRVSGKRVARLGNYTSARLFAEGYTGLMLPLNVKRVVF